MPILEILGHMIVNWDTPKKHKNQRFLAWELIYYFAYNSKTTQCAKLKFEQMLMLMNTLCKSSLGAPDYVTKILQAEIGQKVDEFEPIYLGNYRYWWKLVCGFWAHYQPPFFWLCSVTPTWKLFFWFCIFFHTFFAFFYAIYF